MSYSFPGEKRLKTSSEFRKTLDAGAKSVCRNFVVFALHTDGTGSRIGLIVSKKSGNSVVRNRIKRLTREAYRHMYESLETKKFFDGVDLVVIARPGAAQATLEETKRDFLYCLDKLQRDGKSRAALGNKVKDS